jgi:hypothetical protein
MRSRLAAAALLGVVLASVVTAQAQQVIRVAGAVQWIAGTRMQVMMDSGASVAVDLSEADQSSYQGISNGDLVVVDGVVSPDRRRLVAYELWRDSGRGYWTQAP